MSAPAPDTVARSTVRVLLGYLTTAGFTAVLTLFLVRELGPAAFGVFSLALGIGGLVAFAADFGIAASATRFIAEQRGDDSAIAVVFASAARLKLFVAGAIALTVMLLAAPIADAYDEPTLVWPLRAVAFSVLLEGMFGLFSGSFIAMGRTSLNLRMVISESIVECGGTVLFVVSFGGAAAAAWGRALGYAVGAGAGLALAAWALGRRAAALHRPGTDVRRLARYASTLLIVNGAYSLFSNLDVLLIGAILSSTAVGAFAAPMRLALLLAYPSLALANSIAPRVARTEQGEPEFDAVQNGLHLMIVIGFAVSAPMLAWAGPISDLLLGDDYTDSADVLRAMTPFFFLQGIGILLALSANYLGEARRRIPVAIAAVAVNAAIDLLLLKEIGVVAAAIGTSAGYLVYVVGHLAICGPLMALRAGPLLRTFAGSALAGLAMAGVLAAFGTDDLNALQWVLGLGGAVIAFGAVAIATRALALSDVRRLAAR